MKKPTEHINRAEGRQLFGFDPRGYDAARPDYPDWIFQHLRDADVLQPGTATLEIGAGSGKATRRLLELGAAPLTIVEPDERFADMLTEVTSGGANDATIIHASFEDAVLPAGKFDLVAAATSFHWIDPASGLARVKTLLKPGGGCALFWNVLQLLDAPDAFHDATADLLSTLASSPAGAPDTLPFALDRSAREADARQAGFSRIEYFESRWIYQLSTEQVGKLYEGFSSVQRLSEPRRAQLLAS